ncbi:MAG: PKD domain-containing protein [Candidatus Bathyarchaeota archaeon]|nr:PKD domain-containing protein [Candidatus Bathyarchaeota archaeon]
MNLGETVKFDAGASADNIGIVGYEWNFGDGTTAAGKTVTHQCSNLHSNINS